MAYKLIGKNFLPGDVHAKVTGRAKYAEDIRAEGVADHYRGIRRDLPGLQHVPENARMRLRPPVLRG